MTMVLQINTIICETHTQNMYQSKNVWSVSTTKWKIDALRPCYQRQLTLFRFLIGDWRWEIYKLYAEEYLRLDIILLHII